MRSQLFNRKFLFSLLVVVVFLGLTAVTDGQADFIYKDTFVENKAVVALAFSRDGNILASGGYNRTINLWDTRTGQLLRTLTGHTKSITSVSFSGVSEAGQILASSSVDGSIRFWNPYTGQRLRTFTNAHPGGVQSVSFALGDDVFISGGRDNTAKYWDITESDNPIYTFTGHTDWVLDAKFIWVGWFLSIVSGSRDGTIQMWLPDLEETRTFRGHTDFVTSLSYYAATHDSLTIVSGSRDYTVRLWDLKSDTSTVLRGHTGRVNDVSVGLNGIASASADGTVRLWDVDTGEHLQTLNEHTDVVRVTAFSRDGALLASGDESGTVLLYRVVSGAVVRIPDNNLRISIEKKLVETGIHKELGGQITERDMLLLSRSVYNGRLNLNNSSIQDLTGIEYALSLRELHLDSNRISDISPLAQLTNLRELHLNLNRISDISPLAQLTNLRELYLNSNKISDVSPLSGLVNLEWLTLSRNEILDFSPIVELAKNLKNLENPIGSAQKKGVEIYKSSYSDQGLGVSLGVNVASGKKFAPGSRKELIYTVRRDGKPVVGISLVLTATSYESSASATFSPSKITTGSDGKASTYINFGKRLGAIKIHAEVQGSGKTVNRYGATVYKHSDGNETVLIKGLTLEDLPLATGFSDYGNYYKVFQRSIGYTQYLPPRNGRHFKISAQGNTNGCGPHSALMVLYYYGVDVSVGVFEDVADIHTTVIGVTPAEMKQGLGNLGVPVYKYSGTSDGYSRHQSLRDKISQNRPPIIIIRVTYKGYHHRVIVGYDTKSNKFLIADPGNFRDDLTGELNQGMFQWIDWRSLNSLWSLNSYSSWFNDNVFDLNTALSWFGANPYTMFVPKEAPKYHHLASQTIEVKVRGDVEYNPAKWGWHDWEREMTFGRRVRYAHFFAENDDSSFEKPRIDGNKVLLSGRIQNGTPIDRGFLDGVLTVYYVPGVSAAPAVALPVPPVATTLLPNYPNPFNPETWIPYQLAQPADVTLTIYSIDGKVVRHLNLGHQPAGFYQSKSRAAHWDGRNNVGERVASGVYFYTLKAEEFFATKKLLILK